MALRQGLNASFFSPYSESTLRRFCGKGRLYDYLLRFAIEDYIYIADDFLYEKLDQTNGYWIVDTAGTGDAIDIIPDTAGGIVRITTGTADNDGGRFASQLSFKGDLNCGMMTAVKSNVITEVKIEAGFAASQTESGSVGEVNSLSGGTSTGTDYACMIIDTDDTSNAHGAIWHLATDGSTSGYNATATVNPAGTIAVVNVYDKLCVALEGDASWGFHNGKCVANHGNTTATKVEGATALCVYGFGQTRNNGTARLIDFDYMVIWQDRA